MNGWMGIILRVDLNRGRITREPLKNELATKYVGGRGLNLKYLYDEINPGIDPLGPENKVIFGVGPCNGTLVPGSSRFTISSKSPLTGFIGDANSGGSFGAGLKYAGYDMLIIEGKAESPVYLLIDDDRVELKDASHMWGKTTAETKRTLESEIGDPEVCIVSIGPAGENLVKFACVIADSGRCAARTGIGAVLGSKKLKAVAVRGTKGVKIANPKLLRQAFREIYEVVHADRNYFQGMSAQGRCGGMTLYDILGLLPTKNYQRGTFKEGIQDITGQRLAERYFVKTKSCLYCQVPCDHLYVIDKGPYTGTYGEAMELVQLEQYSSRLMINDLDFTVKASTVSNQYGIDVTDMAAIIGYAMECFEHGILTAEDTGGLQVEWGNADAALELIDLTVRRKGIGNLFAEGVKIASEKIGKGSEKFALHVKGMGLSTGDPRGAKAFGLCYAVASRGADHCRCGIGAEVQLHPGQVGFDPVRGEVRGEAGMDVDRFLEEGKGLMLKWYEDVRAFQNCMETCNFFSYPKELGMPGTCAKLYNAVTGNDLSREDVMLIGERIVNLERVFNIREGLTRKDDTLPDRFLKEPMPDGPAKGQVVDLEPMLDNYYEVRGWDKVTGVPTREEAVRIGLD